ncbi:MAG: hypothetical protein PHE53_01090 [Thermoguttaceae bacterium]|nr:hypothetical protein [Thermoguttaceae bacterium]
MNAHFCIPGKFFPRLLLAVVCFPAIFCGKSGETQCSGAEPLFLRIATDADDEVATETAPNKTLYLVQPSDSQETTSSTPSASLPPSGGRFAQVDENAESTEATSQDTLYAQDTTPGRVIPPHQTSNVSDPLPPLAPKALPAQGGAFGDNVQVAETGSSSPQMYSDEMYQALKNDLSKEPLGWKKGEFEIVPYGILWGSFSTESHPSSIGDASFWLTQPSDTGTQSHLDFRGSILGTTLKGPKVPLLGDLPTSGKVEFDLQRTIDFENKATVHLRHCFVEVQNEDYRLLVGQTWDIVAPLMPGTLMYSAGWFSGNAGYRRAQLRGERYYNLSDTFQVRGQAGIFSPFSADVNIPNVITQRHAQMPMLQGRMAVVMGERGEGKNPVEVGVASHYVPYQYRLRDIDETVDSYGIFVDTKIPLNKGFGVQGEFFYGQNLGQFLANIGEGVSWDPTTDVINGVRGSGGWVNFWYDLTDKSQVKGGWMLDDPKNTDLYASSAVSSVRTRNTHFFSNISYHLTKQFLVGFEYSWWRTDYKGADAGKSNGNRFDFVSIYGF